MRIGWSMCVLVVVGCGGEITQPDAAGVDAGGVMADGGRRCARASECDDGRFCNGAEDCVDTVCIVGAAPCDSVTQQCDEDGESCTAIECTPEAANMDSDGRRSEACGGDDCDDNDGNRYPGNPEVCDTAGHDEDCDPDTFGVRDQDMDGEPDAACCNGEVCGSDCDDTRANVSPRSPEVCGNGLDDDCDGTMDEDLLVDGFADADGDGWGDSTLPMRGVCAGTPGFAPAGGDCDETNPAINPGATEACDTIDNDCDGTPDDGLPTMRCYRDEDGDGYGVTDGSQLRCSCPTGWATFSGDCHDQNIEVHPGAGWHVGAYIHPDCSGLCMATEGDWDCDGVDELRWGTPNATCTPDASGRCVIGVAGWTGSVPTCGVAGNARICDRNCASTSMFLGQQCR
jgi:hypothetical protein